MCGTQRHGFRQSILLGCPCRWRICFVIVFIRIVAAFDTLFCRCKFNAVCVNKIFVSFRMCFRCQRPDLNAPIRNSFYSRTCRKLDALFHEELVSGRSDVGHVALVGEEWPDGISKKGKFSHFTDVQNGHRVTCTRFGTTWEISRRFGAIECGQVNFSQNFIHSQCHQKT